MHPTRQAAEADPEVPADRPDSLDSRVTHDRIHQRRAHRRTARRVRLAAIVDYLEHRRTVPNRGQRRP
jgi:hypothetical protein